MTTKSSHVTPSVDGCCGEHKTTWADETKQSLLTLLTTLPEDYRLVQIAYNYQHVAGQQNVERESENSGRRDTNDDLANVFASGEVFDGFRELVEREDLVDVGPQLLGRDKSKEVAVQLLRSNIDSSDIDRWVS